MDRAEGEEETFALAREVQALRRANMDVQQRLAVAQDEIRSLEMTIAEVSYNARCNSLSARMLAYHGYMYMNMFPDKFVTIMWSRKQMKLAPALFVYF